MGDSFLLAIRRHQVLPNTSAVLCQAPWYRHKGKRKGKNSNRLCIYQRNSLPLRNKCLGEDWRELPGLSDFLDPALSKVPGPLSTWIPSLKNDLGDVSAVQHDGNNPSAISRMGNIRAMPGDGCSWASYGLGRGGLMRLQSFCWQPATSQLWVHVSAWSSPWNTLGTDGAPELEVQARQRNLPKLSLSKAIKPRGGT